MVDEKAHDTKPQIESKLSSPVHVGDIVDASGLRRVDSADSSLLKTQLLQQVVKLAVLRKIWEADVDSGSHSRAEIGWTGGDVAQMVVVLVLPSVIEDILFNVAETAAPTFKDLLQIAAFLHGDDLFDALMVRWISRFSGGWWSLVNEDIRLK